jgi:hypothetical protein
MSKKFRRRPPPEQVKPEMAKPAPAAAVPVNAAQLFRDLMTPRDCVLPVMGITVRLARPTVKHMVDAGLLVLALDPVDLKAMSEAEQDVYMGHIRTQARRLLCACAIDPKVTPDGRGDTVDMRLVCDEDLMAVHAHLLNWGGSIFYGTHRALTGIDLMTAEGRAWFDGQTQAAGIVYLVAQHCGIPLQDMDDMDPQVFARLHAYFEAGRGMEKHG